MKSLVRLSLANRALVALAAVAAVTTQTAPVKLGRTDGRRAVTVTAKATGKDLGTVSSQVKKKVKARLGRRRHRDVPAGPDRERQAARA